MTEIVEKASQQLLASGHCKKGVEEANSATRNRAHCSKTEESARIVDDHLEADKLYQKPKHQAKSATAQTGVETEKPIVVLAPPDHRPWWSVGAGAHDRAFHNAQIAQLCGQVKILNFEPKTVGEMIDGLVSESKQSGKRLGNIVIDSHGAKNGVIGLGDTRVDLKGALLEFLYLKRYIAPGSTIEFTGCDVAGGAHGLDTLKHLAHASGATVRAHRGPALVLFSLFCAGAYVEVTPQGRVHSGVQWF